MKVLVLAGGDSSEREVSLNSGRAVVASLSGRDHQVLALDPATGRSLLDRNGRYLADSPSTGSGEVSLLGGAVDLIATLNSEPYGDVDCCFLALHGGIGEDGTIQRLLDLVGLPYTGSRATSSVVAMDKALTKHICRSLEIATPRWQLHRRPDGRIDRALHDALVSGFDFPFIIKPNDSGSTVGLSKVEAAEQVTPALIDVLGETTNILAEDYIAGRELTVAILDGMALPIVEIVAAKGLYDYEAKYTKGGSRYFCPADIPDNVRDRLQHDAERLYDALGCRGVARVDFIVDQNGRGWCLELNTIPGMTELSLVPMAARAAGIDFSELVERMLRSGPGEDS